MSALGALMPETEFLRQDSAKKKLWKILSPVLVLDWSSLLAKRWKASIGLELTFERPVTVFQDPDLIHSFCISSLDGKVAAVATTKVHLSL